MTDLDEPSASRRVIKTREVMIAGVVPETDDTVTLVFFTGNDRLEYRAGHFLTIDPHQFESLERFTEFLEDLEGGASRSAPTRCRPRHTRSIWP